MKFYKITENCILRLDTIRTVQVIGRDIRIYYTCGDTRGDVVSFKSDGEAAEAFDKLCDELYRL